MKKELQIFDFHGSLKTRVEAEKYIRAALKRNKDKAVMLFEPRQCWKITLARELVGGASLIYF